MADIFRFLFADKDDIFFTEHLMKLDLEQYIYYQMKKEGFEEIFFIEAVNGENMKVFCESQRSGNVYVQNIPKVVLPLAGLMGMPMFQVDQDFYRTRYALQQRKEQVKKTIENLITTKPDDKYVFVFAEGTFEKLYSGILEIRGLNSVLLQRHHKSQFVLIESLKSKEKLPDLPEYAISISQQEMINVKTNQELLSDRLKRSENLSVFVWNPFEKEQVDRMIRRILLEKQDPHMRLEKQKQYLCNLFEHADTVKVAGAQVSNKKDLYDKVISVNTRMNILNNQGNIKASGS